MLNRRLYLLILCLVSFLPTLYSQTPEGINYQAVARDGNGDILFNETISVRFSVRKNNPVDTIVYQETHNATTNQFGLFTLIIGEGSATVGVLADVDWGSDSYFLQVEVDNGAGYANLGSTQLLSVPYALYAKEAGNGGGGSGDDWGTQVVQTDGTLSGDGTSGNELGLAPQGAANGEVLTWNGSQWEPATPSGGSGLWQRNGNYVFNLNDSIGIGVSQPVAKLQVNGGGDVLFGDETGERMMWIADKGAFRAGLSTNSGWDPDSIGNRSVAFGHDTKALNSYSVAFGRDTRASGIFSMATGSNTTASNHSATAMGRSTIASGFQSTAMGRSTLASGDYSTAVGNSTEASGQYSTALGRNSIASGTQSTAMGNDTEASGTNSIAMGNGTMASGLNATAMGYNTEASENYTTAMGFSSTANTMHAIAIGRNTLASGVTAVAIGEGPIASGDYSLATGHNTWAAGRRSTAMGDNTYAAGRYSTAMGQSTTAESGYETAIGRFNTGYSPSSTTGWNSTDRLFVIGNGTSASTKSDALVVLKNGNIGIGTSTPVASLHLQLQGTALTDAIRMTSSINSSANWSLSLNPKDDFVIRDGGQTTLIIKDSTQYVGIGTTTPDNPLEVYGDVQSTFFDKGIIYAEHTGGSLNEASAVMGVNPHGAGGFFKGRWGVVARTYNTGTRAIAIDAFVNHADVGYGIKTEVHGNAIANYGIYSLGLIGPSGAVYAGWFDGDVHIAGTITNPSDRKFKDEIEPLEGSLDKVRQIETYSYNYKETEGMNFSKERQMGFIAQELEEVFPELVKDEVNAVPGDRESEEEPLIIKYKGINYLGMIPVLTQAIKEQQEIIEDQQAQLEALEQRLSDLESQ